MKRISCIGKNPSPPQNAGPSLEKVHHSDLLAQQRLSSHAI